MQLTHRKTLEYFTRLPDVIELVRGQSNSLARVEREMRRELMNE